MTNVQISRHKAYSSRDCGLAVPGNRNLDFAAATDAGLLLGVGALVSTRVLSNGLLPGLHNTCQSNHTLLQNIQCLSMMNVSFQREG